MKTVIELLLWARDLAIVQGRTEAAARIAALAAELTVSCEPSTDGEYIRTEQ